jgi:hypothetical protein
MSDVETHSVQQQADNAEGDEISEKIETFDANDTSDLVNNKE